MALRRALPSSLRSQICTPFCTPFVEKLGKHGQPLAAGLLHSYSIEAGNTHWAARMLWMIIVVSAGCAASAGVAAPVGALADRPQSEERLSFQAEDPYRPRVHLNADVAMVYGIDKTLPQRIKGWRDKGYIVHVMTGVAWGEYQDYYFGRWDGKNREDEAQRMKSGEIIGDGHEIYYISPGEDYGRYLCEGIKRALDAGAEAIHLEEREYWVRAGWSNRFKRQWQKFYNEPWIEPDSSPD